jgi:hypothetical protein
VEEEKPIVEDKPEKPEEEELEEEDVATEKSMRLTTLTFILATILVLAFAGVVYSLIL